MIGHVKATLYCGVKMPAAPTQNVFTVQAWDCCFVWLVRTSQNFQVNIFFLDCGFQVQEGEKKPHPSFLLLLVIHFWSCRIFKSSTCTFLSEQVSSHSCTALAWWCKRKSTLKLFTSWKLIVFYATLNWKVKITSHRMHSVEFCIWAYARIMYAAKF